LDLNDAVVTQTKTKIGRRASSVAGRDIWNSLPPDIRLTENFAASIKLKTYLLTLLLNNYKFYLLFLLLILVFISFQTLDFTHRQLLLF